MADIAKAAGFGVLPPVLIPGQLAVPKRTPIFLHDFAFAAHINMDLII